MSSRHTKNAATSLRCWNLFDSKGEQVRWNTNMTLNTHTQLYMHVIMLVTVARTSRRKLSSDCSVHTAERSRRVRLYGAVGGCAGWCQLSQCVCKNLKTIQKKIQVICSYWVGYSLWSHLLLIGKLVGRSLASPVCMLNIMCKILIPNWSDVSVGVWMRVNVEKPLM